MKSYPLIVSFFWLALLVLSGCAENNPETKSENPRNTSTQTAYSKSQLFKTLKIDASPVASTIRNIVTEIQQSLTNSVNSPTNDPCFYSLLSKNKDLYIQEINCTRPHSKKNNSTKLSVFSATTLKKSTPTCNEMDQAANCTIDSKNHWIQTGSISSQNRIARNGKIQLLNKIDVKFTAIAKRDKSGIIDYNVIAQFEASNTLPEESNYVSSMYLQGKRLTFNSTLLNDSGTFVPLISNIRFENTYLSEIEAPWEIKLSDKALTALQAEQKTTGPEKALDFPTRPHFFPSQSDDAYFTSISGTMDVRRTSSCANPIGGMKMAMTPLRGRNILNILKSENTPSITYMMDIDINSSVAIAVGSSRRSPALDCQAQTRQSFAPINNLKAAEYYLKLSHVQKKTKR